MTMYTKIFPVLLITMSCFACVSQATPSDKHMKNKPSAVHVNQSHQYFPRGVRQRFPTDCNEVFARGPTKTGGYILKPEGAPRPYMVRCEMERGPWTVLMRRFNGKADFRRTWNEYKNGFGYVDSEHWAGNEFMHYLTNQRPYKVRLDMKVWSSGATSYSEFTQFWIGPESSGYQLLISGETGSAVRGGMTYHNGMKFSTKDRDNDLGSNRHCAASFPGGWWFRNCFLCAFNRSV